MRHNTRLENELATRAQAGDHAAIGDLLKALERPAHAIARKHAPELFVDLVATAQVAIVDALKTWKPEKGNFFSYYWTVAEREVARISFSLRATVGGGDAHLRAVRAARKRQKIGLALDTKGNAALAALAPAVEPDPIDGMEDRLLDRLELASLLRKLGPRARAAVEYRWGLRGGQEHTLAEIAKKIGVSDSRVSQLIHAALAKMNALSLGHV